MSHAAAGRRTGQRFMRTYATTVANAISLLTTYLRDTVIVDDTDATGATVIAFPKIGTAYAPVGLRVTFRKTSNVAQAVHLDPHILDVMSANAAAAYPSFAAVGVLNSAALPASVCNSVTLEATNMAITGRTQPSPTGGTPTTAGAWMLVASSVTGI